MTEDEYMPGEEPELTEEDILKYSETSLGENIDATRTTPSNAESNRGGGGAGGSDANAGSNGGSGVVVVRYSDTYSPASATTGSPTVTVSGGYRVYRWTSSGSITF